MATSCALADSCHSIRHGDMVTDLLGRALLGENDLPKSTLTQVLNHFVFIHDEVGKVDDSRVLIFSS
jgi:hypothetical protein